MIAGCSGKSGLPGSTDNPPAPLEIVSISPADGAADIAPDARVSVVFSRNIATPAAGALSLSGSNGAIPGVVGVNASTLTFSATRLEDPGAAITVSLAGTVAAADGGDPAPAKTWHFSLRSTREWTTESLGSGREPRVALDDTGRIYVAARGEISRWNGAAGWETRTLDGASPRDAIVATHGTDAWVLWVDGAALRSMKSSDGVWEASTAVKEGLKRIAEPRLALTGGEPIAIWAQSGGEVWATGANLSTPTKLSTPNTYAFNPRIASTADGAIAVWRESDGAKAWIVASHFTTSWSYPTRLSSASPDAYEPDVAGIDGGALAAWSQRSSGTSSAASLWTARFTSSGWSTAQQSFVAAVTGTNDVSGAGIGGVTMPSLAPDGAGGAWLSGRQRDGKTLASTNIAALKLVHFQSGAFGSIATIDSGAGGDPAQASAVCEADGCTLVWQRGLSPATKLVVASPLSAAPEVFAEPGARDPRIARAHGREVRVWRRADGTLAVSRLN